MKYELIVAACCITWSSFGYGQVDRQKYLELTDRADSLYNAKEYAAAARLYSAAVRSLPDPGRPNDRYNAACSWSLAGNLDSALAYLEMAASAGYADHAHVLEDGDLEPLHTHAGWEPFVACVKRNREMQKAITSEKWKEDLLQLKRLLEIWHVDPYHATPKAVFDSEVATLLKRVDTLENDEMVLEIERIVALAGDGHTSFYPGDQRVVGFRYFPLVLGQFEEGLFAISVADSLSDIAGMELMAIEDTPMEEVRQKLIPYLSRDNDAEITYTYPDFVQCANLLHLLGITSSPSEATFVFESNGAKVARKIHALGGAEYNDLHWVAARASLNKIASSTNHTFLFSDPITVTHLMDRPYYWSQVFTAEKVVFLQYLTCWDQEGRPTFQDHLNQEVFAVLDKNPDHRLVIDMRYNSGGEPATAAPLIKGIQQRAALFAKHPPIVLVGMRTYSAAATNVCQLRDLCHAQLIGQFSRARPNCPSEGRNFQLRNSGCTISISTRMMRRSPELADASYIPLDEVVPLKYADYAADKDRTLERAFSLSRE